LGKFPVRISDILTGRWWFYSFCFRQRAGQYAD
jgi:hypothetical protein